MQHHFERITASYKKQVISADKQMSIYVCFVLKSELESGHRFIRYQIGNDDKKSFKNSKLLSDVLLLLQQNHRQFFVY
jgi:hypothetical protein